jgi:hypothetical protein
MKRIFPVILILAAGLACRLVPALPGFSSQPTADLDIRIETAIAQTQAAQPTDPPPTATEPSTATPEPTQTPEPSPEQLLSGEHRYWTEVEERGCSAADPELYPRYRVKTLEFGPDYSTAAYGGREYQRVREHRYQSENQDEKPLILEFRPDGFSLLIFEAGSDPEQVPPCLIYTFTLDEE